MKNTWELRQANKIAIPKLQDSEYKPIERELKVFNPLRISKVNHIIYKLLCNNLNYRDWKKICHLNRKRKSNAFL